MLLPSPLLVLVLLCSRLRCPARGIYPVTQTAHVAPVLIHLFRSSSFPSRLSSVFVSGDAYANSAALLFLSLKIAVLLVADGRRPGRRAAVFQPG